MEDTKKIPTYQFISVITISEIMHQYTYLPILNTRPSNQDAWMFALLFIPYIIILSLPILFLLKKFKSINFFDMMRLILGKIGGKIAILILNIFFWFCNVACLTLSIIFIRTYIFFNTPTWVIIIAILTPVAYITFKGFKTISNLSIFVIFGIIFTLIAFFIFGLNSLDFSELKPVLADSTLFQLNWGGFITAARFSDILVILALAYRLKDQNKTNKVFFSSIILYVILTLLIVIPVITLIGVDYARQAYNPYFLYSKQIEFYTFLQRAEVLVMFSWLSGAILKISIYHYLMSYYLAKAFNVKNYKRLVIPVTLTTFFSITLFGLDKSTTMYFVRSDSFFPWVVLIFIFVIPIIILIIYLIRKKKIEKYKFSIS